jgi:Tol biopolymer transport system component
MLKPGEHVGSYRLVSLLGAGGMGQVFRASDERIGRDVAIKFLLPSTVIDPERLRRFEQEARAAGKVNHPNLLAVFDVGSHDDAPFIVSELLDGKTLRDRLQQGRLSSRNVLDIGAQIARGLAAAHEKGLVHRDLKPENIFITEDGRVKILDFGLVKLTQPEAPNEDREGPTVRMQTTPGVVMGTVGYMSPEQVRGEAVDARSDIFSLGVVLYEMVSGRRPFQRGTSIDTMHAILNDDPEDLNPTEVLSPALTRVIARCLEKSASRRFQSASDLAFNLESLTGVTTPLSGVATVPKRSRHWPRIVAGVIGVAALLGAAVLVSRLRRPYEANLPHHQLTFRRGTIVEARFASDASVVYSASWSGAHPEVFTVPANGMESKSSGLRDAIVMSVAPSGEMALLMDVRSDLGPGPGAYLGTLARLPPGGSAPRQILENVTEADWSPNGETLAVAVLEKGRMRIEYPVGKKIYDQSTGWIGHMRISPDGKEIAFLDHPDFGDDRGSVAIVNIASGRKSTLTPEWAGEEGLAWRGDEVWFTGGSVGAFDLRAVNRAGRLRTVASIPGGLRLHDVSATGRVLYAQDNASFGMTGRTGDGPEHDITALGFDIPNDLTRDGRKVLFTYQGAAASSEYDVYLRDMDGSSFVHLGPGGATNFSPDERYVLVIHHPSRLELLPAGAGLPKTIARGPITQYDGATLLADGSVLFAGREAGHRGRVYVQKLDGSAPRPITPEGTGFGQLVHPASPDGKRFFYFNDVRQLVVVCAIAGSPCSTITLQPREEAIDWTADGHIVTERHVDGRLDVLHLDVATGQRVIVRSETPADSAGVQYVGSFLSTPDGKSFVYGYYKLLSTLYAADELK